MGRSHAKACRTRRACSLAGCERLQSRPIQPLLVLDGLSSNSSSARLTTLRAITRFRGFFAVRARFLVDQTNSVSAPDDRKPYTRVAGCIFPLFPAPP